MNIKEIQELIKFVSKSGVNEVSIEQEGFKITIKTSNPDAGNSPMPAVVYSPPPVVQAPVAIRSQVSEIAEPEPKKAMDNSSNLLIIRSPMIGTFYRTPGPEKPNFVNIGDEIAPGKVVCIIEAMKLFNDIESEIAGRIVKVLVENAHPVEYDQPLFLVEPL